MSPLAGQNYESDGVRRTYREPETPDRATGKTVVQTAVDYYFDLYKQQAAKEAAEEQARLERQRQRQEAGRQESERKAKLAQARLAIELEDDLLERTGFGTAMTWTLKAK